MKIEIKKSLKYVDFDVAVRFLEKRVEDVINEKKPDLYTPKTIQEENSTKKRRKIKINKMILKI